MEFMSIGSGRDLDRNRALHETLLCPTYRNRSLWFESNLGTDEELEAQYQK